MKSNLANPTPAERRKIPPAATIRWEVVTRAVERAGIAAARDG